MLRVGLVLQVSIIYRHTLIRPTLPIPSQYQIHGDIGGHRDRWLGAHIMVEAGIAGFEVTTSPWIGWLPNKLRRPWPCASYKAGERAGHREVKVAVIETLRVVLSLLLSRYPLSLIW